MPTRDLSAIYDTLTDRQEQTLDLVGEGRTHKEIAAKLNISATASNERIMTLRNKFGGVTKAELARIHRKYREKHPPENVSGQTFHLQEEPVAEPVGWRHHSGSMLGLEDSAPVFRFDAPWSQADEPHVVPEVLDGENASIYRWAASIGIAVGLLVVAVLMLAVSDAIGRLLG